MLRRHSGDLGILVTAAILVVSLLACSDDDSDNDAPASFRLETNRLCALVPARDPAAAAFPPTPPVRAFGTDLGWTYERNGTITMLFGDTWQRIDICPLQPNDDSLATLEIPADDWPGFTARDSIPDAQCPELTFAIDEAGTAFAPIVLTRWDGVPVPLVPLNTPVFGFHDGEREWGVFIVAGGQACTEEEANAGAPCPDVLSAQAADLVCGFPGPNPLCFDPTSTKRDAGAQAYYLHFAERVGETSYVTRAMFLTSKYFNLTGRAVAAFDPEGDGARDYRPGTSALVMWGRPGFDDLNHDGELPPYFMYHPLPFEISGDRIVFEPRYFRGVVDGAPTFSSNQADATPLYTDEFEPVNHTAVSFIAPLAQWFMFYGGSSVDYVNVDNTSGQSQPVSGGLFSRHAPDPWGPWTDPELVMPEETVAEDMVCGKRHPAGCLPPPDPLIRPGCLEFVDPQGGGVLYGANIIDSFTRAVPAETGNGPAADVFWVVSTWHPYAVVLVKTHIERE